MLQKRKKWLTTAGTALIVLAVSLSFAFKSSKVASAPPAEDYYWYYTGTGSAEDADNYRFFAPVTVPSYTVDSYCTAGYEEVCILIAPKNPNNGNRPIFSSSLAYSLHVIVSGQSVSIPGIKMRSKNH